MFGFRMVLASPPWGRLRDGHFPANGDENSSFIIHPCSLVGRIRELTVQQFSSAIPNLKLVMEGR